MNPQPQPDNTTLALDRVCQDFLAETGRLRFTIALQAVELTQLRQQLAAIEAEKQAATGAGKPAQEPQAK